MTPRIWWIRFKLKVFWMKRYFHSQNRMLIEFKRVYSVSILVLFYHFCLHQASICIWGYKHYLNFQFSLTGQKMYCWWITLTCLSKISYIFNIRIFSSSRGNPGKTFKLALYFVFKKWNLLNLNWKVSLSLKALVEIWQQNQLVFAFLVSARVASRTTAYLFKCEFYVCVIKDPKY